MKQLTIKSLISATFLLFSMQAQALLLSPGSEIDSGPNPAINPDNSQSQITAYIESTYGVNELYKTEDGGGVEEGSFLNSYDSVFDDNGGTITYTGSTAIDCPTCYLLVKDGANDPYWYLFDLNSWDGTESITLSGFWEGTQGAISNIAIFGDGGKNVPEPGVLALLGIGILGFGLRKLKRS